MNQVSQRKWGIRIFLVLVILGLLAWIVVTMLKDSAPEEIDTGINTEMDTIDQLETQLEDGKG